MGTSAGEHRLAGFAERGQFSGGTGDWRAMNVTPVWRSRLTPVFQIQSSNPRKVASISSDDVQAMLKRRSRDDEIGVFLWCSRSSGCHPLVRRAVEDAFRDGQDDGVPTERVELLELSGRGHFLQAPNDLVAGHGREGEMPMGSQVRCGLSSDNGMFLFEDFRKDVRIDEQGRHGSLGKSGQIGALENDRLDFRDLLIAEAFVDIAPIRQFSGRGAARVFLAVIVFLARRDDLDDELLVIPKRPTEDMFKHASLVRLEVADVAFDGFHGGIIPQNRT